MIKLSKKNYGILKGSKRAEFTDKRKSESFLVSGPEHLVIKKPFPVYCVEMPADFEVETLGGTTQGKKGDYLMQGINGELYPCTKEIFKKTYMTIGKFNGATILKMFLNAMRAK